MHLVQVGRRWINLEYMILAEQWDGSTETAAIPQGGLRVTLEDGKGFDLPPPESDELARHLFAAFISPSAEQFPATVTGVTELVRAGASGARAGTGEEPG